MLGKQNVFPVKEPNDKLMDRREKGGRELLGLDVPKMASLRHFSLPGLQEL